MSLDHESAQLFLINKAQSCIEFHRYKEAIECFDKCMSINEATAQYIVALAGKANAYFLTKRYNEAMTFIDKALELDPENKNYIYQRANTFLGIEKVEKALEEFKKVIVIDPNHTNAIGSVGNCLFKLDRFKEAISYFNRVIAMLEKNGEHTSSFYKTMMSNRYTALDFYDLSLIEKEKVDDFYQILLKFEI